MFLMGVMMLLNLHQGPVQKINLRTWHSSAAIQAKGKILKARGVASLAVMSRECGRTLRFMGESGQSWMELNRVWNWMTSERWVLLGGKAIACLVLVKRFRVQFQSCWDRSQWKVMLRTVSDETLHSQCVFPSGPPSPYHWLQVWIKGPSQKIKFTQSGSSPFHSTVFTK